MKIMKIFGLVVAVHAAVFMLIFAIPGCRSSARQNAGVSPAPAPADPMISYAAPANSASLSSSELNPAITPAPMFDPNAPATASGSIRFSPTRPGAAAQSLTPPPPEAAPTVNYSVVKGDSLWTVAKRHGITVAELASANNLMANATLQLNQKLIIPQKAVAPAAAGATTPAADAPSYTVKSGDTLGAIARRNGTTVEALRSANRLSGDVVRAGQVLLLPVGATVPAADAATTAAPAASSSRPANSVTHTVAPGETLSEIARRYGVRYAEIATANNITDPTRVRAGQELVIPGWQAPGGTAAAASSPSPAPATPAASTNAPILFIPGAADDLPPAPASSGDVPVIRVDEPGSAADSGAPRIN